MTIFDKKEEKQEIEERVLSDELLIREDIRLQSLSALLADVNRDARRATDDSMVLGYNVTEARKLIVALREKLVLVDYWKKKLE